MRYLILMTLLSLLTACASQNLGESRNPDTVCNDKGLEVGTEAYNNCVTAEISAHCATEKGFKQGTDAYKKCEEDLRNAIFTRQQLRIRGH